MAIEYKWIIYKLETKTEESIEDCVVTVHWNRSGVDENRYRASRLGEVEVTTVGMNLSNFVEYDDLTPGVVVEWVKSEVDVTAIDAAIATEIAEKNNPKVDRGLPWRYRADDVYMV